VSRRSGGCCSLGRGGRGFGDFVALGPHLVQISLGDLVSHVIKEYTVYWVVVMPLISFTVHEYHDVRKIIIVVDDVS
jgi:hypothetical protein